MRFLLILFVFPCLLFGQLNEKIDKSQKKAVQESPFLKSGKAMKNELSQQFKQRIQYLPFIEDLRLKNPNDTLMLVENYSFICLGCQADFVQIISKEMYIELNQEEIENNNYEINMISLVEAFKNEAYYLSDVKELKEEISQSEQWNANPKKYGTDDCFDGGHTFYSVIYPDGKITSMYMRCWIDKLFRNSKFE